jgi:4-hydroxy-3-polyprenylbenzoate decarboxylase
MAFADLRDFLSALDVAGQLAHISPEVSPVFEIGAISRQALTENGPGLLFECVAGTPHRVATNLLATRERLAIALGVPPNEIPTFWNERANQSIEPILTDEGACQEIVCTGDDVDLNRFAMPIWNEHDGGPYITFPCYITQNPATGGYDCGMYRTQVFDERTVGLNARPFKGINRNRAAASDADEGFPVAIVIGLDPAVHVATVAGLPHGMSELAVAGSLRGEPVRLVPCQTVPLAVPADAEIVLEGRVTGEQRQEGPFGEYHGYYGRGGSRPAISLTAITCRADAINQQVYEGRPPHEDAVMHGTIIACEIFRRMPIPGVTAVNVTPHSGGHLHCVVAVNKPDDSYGKRVGLAVLALRGVKLVTVVDEDVDVFDPGQVEWATTTRVDFAKDVEIINWTTIDPSAAADDRMHELTRGPKMIIDATRARSATFPLEAKPPADVIERVARDWASYQIT